MTEDDITITRGKVARVIDEYRLEEMGTRLERAWKGDGQQRRSLRELATVFNRKVLATAMREAGLQPVSGEVNNLYRLLTDDDVSAGQQIEAEAKLNRAGLDTGQLRRDFVSHQAIHTYLTDYRNVDPPTTDASDRTDGALATIQRTAGRLESVTEGTLDGLANSGDLTLGSFDVAVSTQVYCEDCESQYEVSELVKRGGCDCH